MRPDTLGPGPRGRLRCPDERKPREADREPSLGFVVKGDQDGGFFPTPLGFQNETLAELGVLDSIAYLKVALIHGTFSDPPNQTMEFCCFDNGPCGSAAHRVPPRPPTRVAPR